MRAVTDATRRRAGVAHALVLAALGAGCAGGGPEPTARPGAPDDAEEIEVRVENDTPYLLRVEVLADGRHATLGDVSPVSDSTFRLPPHLVGPGRRYRLVADPIGPALCYVSDGVLGSPGDVIEWRLFGDPGSPCRR